MSKMAVVTVGTKAIGRAIVDKLASEKDLPDERFIKPADLAASVFSAYSMSQSTMVEEMLLQLQPGDI